MAEQLSSAVRTALAAAYESSIGASPVLRIYDLAGAAPADCAAAITGAILAEIPMPADWATQAAGVLSLAGVWQDASANNAGIADFYRMFDTGITTCHVQGTVTATGGGGDLQLNNTNIAAGQPVSVTSWSRTMPGA